MSSGFVVAPLLGAALAVAATHAVADNVGPPIAVRYGDVDPSTAQGADVLYKRIRTAAVSVCSPLEHGDVSSKQNANACVQTLIEHAVSSVGTQALRAVYAAKYRGTVVRRR